MDNIDYTNFTSEELMTEVERLKHELDNAQLRVAQIKQDIIRAQDAFLKKSAVHGFPPYEIKTSIIDDDRNMRPITVYFPIR